MKCVVVYDNDEGKGLENGWGFSAYIEANEKKILFDTGCDGNALLYNMKKLSIDPKELDIIFISHGHGDHTGGLFAVLHKTKMPKLYIPASAAMLEKIAGGKAEVVKVSEPLEISKGIWSTGELRGIEQSLVVSTEKGNVIICGCSHPGLDVIIESAKKFGKVYGVIGGFHGFSKLEALEGIRFIAPCHCTVNKLNILEKFLETAKECRTGSIFEI